MKDMYACMYVDLWSLLFKSVFSFSHHELYSSYLQTLPFIILYLICSNIEIKILILYNIYDHVIPFAQIVHLCPEMHAIEKMANLAKKNCQSYVSHAPPAISLSTVSYPWPQVSGGQYSREAYLIQCKRENIHSALGICHEAR